ncbi:MAG TPA: alcohol dehydrogenase catalytic domain-containing protein [Terriglobia bacterium]|nr:alcohol dehydrogenase catalytic domain-containing protein [Terriglobia bacterium]
MKALVYTAPKKLEWQDWENPELGPGDALVRVSSAGVCGSDIHGWLGNSRGRVPPLVLGHEMAGVVEEVREDDSAVRPGDFVAVYPLLGCGECRYCADGRDRLCRRRKLLGMHRAGGFAEFVAVPAKNLYPLPASMDAAAGALVEPLANALHFVEYAQYDAGPIAILGAGAIGLLMLQAARQMQSAQDGGRLFPRIAMTEISPYRAAMARQLGADLVVDPRGSDALEALQSFFGEDGCTAVLDAAGFSASRQLALKLVASGGLVGMVGMGDAETTFDCVEAVRREVSLAGIYGYGRDEFQRAIEWMKDGRIEASGWVSEAPLPEGQSVFEDLDRPGSEKIKVILKPPE